MFRICLAATFLALLPSAVSAQHHHHHHHHGSHYGHTNWNYVVPHSHHHHGAYYVQGNSYYYTPSPVVYVDASQYPTHVHPSVQQPMALQYGGFSRCDDLTGRLEAQLNLLCLELHYNYQHNQDFAHTYREAYELLQIARQLHALDHEGQRQAIQESVTTLDQKFHHVQEDIAQWMRRPNRHLPPGDANQKGSTAEALLHHLCFDIGVKPHEDEAVPPPGANEAPPAPGN